MDAENQRRGRKIEADLRQLGQEWLLCDEEHKIISGESQKKDS